MVRRRAGRRRGGDRRVSPGRRALRRAAALSLARVESRRPDAKTLPMRVASAAAAMLCGICTAAHADWWKANFHAHAANADVNDDGSELPAVLHEAMAARGFHISVHTPHSNLAPGAGAEMAWRRAV